MPTHTPEGNARPCSSCGAQPDEIAAYPEGCSDLARAIHKRGRAAHVFPVSGFFDLGAKPIHALTLRILSVGEECEAVDAAHRTRAEQAKRAGAGEETARRDPGNLEREQTLEALFRASRGVDEKGQPTPWAAFPGVSYMRREFSTDMTACLLALYDELKRKHGPTKLEIDDETVETLARVLNDHRGDDMPEAILAPYPRWFLTHLAVMLASRLADARRSVEVLLSEKEAREAEEKPSPSQRARAAGHLPGCLDNEDGTWGCVPGCPLMVLG